jgi:hypothetical protein
MQKINPVLHRIEHRSALKCQRERRSKTDGIIIIFYIISWGGVRLSPLGTSATNCPIVPARDNRWWWWVWSCRWNKNWQGKPKYSEKTCSNATLSTTNPTWPDVGSDPGRRGGKPATNRLIYGRALKEIVTEKLICTYNKTNTRTFLVANLFIVTNYNKCCKWSLRACRQASASFILLTKTRKNTAWGCP